LKWSLAFRLYIGSYQEQFIQPSWDECFCVFSLGLCFVCSFMLFDLFVCLCLCFREQLSHLPYSFWR